MGGEGRPVRVFVAGHRRRPRVPDRQRATPSRVQRGHGQGSLAEAARHGAEGAARARRRQAVRRDRSGKFFIVRPHPDRAEVLSEVELPLGTADSAGQTEGMPEPIFGGAAISRGRVFFVSSDAVYAFGPKTAKALTGFAVDAAGREGRGRARRGSR